jgi:hypothetical protein
MSHPRELLDSAVSLIQVDPETQATLRRAVSTAYYALFHFLIEETCRNWIRVEQRHRLTRRFDHGIMATASRQLTGRLKKRADGSVEARLRSVADAFVELRQRRESADYDLSAVFSFNDVALDIFLVEEAFASWELIRHEQIAQDYLFSLLFKDRA